MRYFLIHPSRDQSSLFLPSSPPALLATNASSIRLEAEQSREHVASTVGTNSINIDTPVYATIYSLLAVSNEKAKRGRKRERETHTQNLQQPSSRLSAFVPIHLMPITALPLRAGSTSLAPRSHVAVVLYPIFIPILPFPPVPCLHPNRAPQPIHRPTRWAWRSVT